MRGITERQARNFTEPHQRHDDLLRYGGAFIKSKTHIHCILRIDRSFGQFRKQLFIPLT